MGGRGWNLPLILLQMTGLSAGLLISTPPVTTACAGAPDHRVAPRGLIRAPSSRDLINCSWIIEASPADRVTINISSFHLPCSVGRLTLRQRGREPRDLCGVAHPASFTFAGGPVLVQLRSSYSLRAAFRLHYSRDPVCEAEQSLCPSGGCTRDPRLCRSPVPAAASPAPAAASPAPATCSARHLRAFFGWFSSPGLGSSLPRAACRCSWLLDPVERRPLELRLTLALGAGDRLWVSGTGTGTGTVGVGGSEFRGSVGGGRRAAVVRTVSLAAGTALVRYVSTGGPEAGGFTAVYQVRGYCAPGLHPCRDGGTPGCFSPEQRCDGRWDCEAGADEADCPQCPAGQYPCGARAGSGSGRRCYPAAERCNYRAACPEAGDERGCRRCQPGTFHCGPGVGPGVRWAWAGDRDPMGGRCVLESWRCDGQADCADGSDERGCSLPLPRKVTAAAALGSLVCGLLLVLALGCSCKLYSLRGSHSLLTPLTRMEAAFVQRRAPPSYGQLIADGAIPPVEDFPTENPNDASVLGNLRAVLQLLRQGPPRRRRRRHRTLRRLSRRFRRSRLWALLVPTRVAAGAPDTEPETEPDPPAAAADTVVPAKPGLHPEEPLAADPGQPGDPADLPLLPLAPRDRPTPSPTGAQGASG